MLPGVNSHVKTVEAGRPSENDQEMDGTKEGWEVTLFFCMPTPASRLAR